MTKTFDDVSTANEVMQSIVTRVLKEIDKARPDYRYATVTSIDAADNTARVTYPESGGNDFAVSVGSHAPAYVGQKVRVAGRLGDKYIDDIPSGQTIANDKGIPNPCTSVTIAQTPYVDANGVNFVQAAVTWQAPYTNTNGSDILDFDHYEVQTVITNPAPNPLVTPDPLTGGWSKSTNSYTTLSSVDGLLVGSQLCVRVRMVDQSKNWGDWAYSSPVKIVNSVSTNLNTPSTPTVANYLGLLRATWDGLDNTGLSEPASFLYLEVHWSTVANFTPSAATLKNTSLKARGDTFFSPPGYGVTYYCKFIAVGTNGVKTGWTPDNVGATNSQVVNADIGPQAVSTTQIANNAVTAAQIAAGAVGASQVSFTARQIGAVTTSTQASAPSNPITGDLWIDTSNGNVIKTYNGTAWTANLLSTVNLSGTISATQAGFNARAIGGITTYTQSTTPTGALTNDLWVDTGNGNVIKTYNGTSWVVNSLSTTQLAGTITAAQAGFTARAIGAITTTTSSTAPTGPIAGDIWIDSGNGNIIKRYSGSAWVANALSTVNLTGTITAAQAGFTARQIGSVTTYTQSTAPTSPIAGDLWIDSGNGNVVKTYTGSAWTANLLATTNLSGTITSAQAGFTARQIGAVTTYTQSATPASPLAGDLWIDTGNGNVVKTYNGTAWVSNPLSTVNLSGTITSAQAGFIARSIGGISTTTSAIAPSSPITGDIWIDSGNGNVVKTYSGSAWVANLLATTNLTGTITATQAGFTARGIGGLATTTSATAPSLPLTGDIWIDTGNGNVVKTYNGSAWVANTVGTAAIASGAVTAATIAANTITSAQIAANTITATQIAANTIGAGQIVANSIGAGQITANSITAAQIAANTITASQIAANTITASQIAANTIGAGQIVANSITAAQIAANTITASQIAANTITATQIAANAISTGQLAAGAVTAAQIAAGAITATKLSISVGSGNVFANTAFLVNPATGFASSWAYGCTVDTTTTAISGNSFVFAANSSYTYAVQNYPFAVGQTYTVSYYVKAETGFSAPSGAGVVCSEGVSSSSGPTSYLETTPPTTWTRRIFTFTVSSTSGTPHLLIVNTYGGTTTGSARVWFSNLQVELGDTATGWGPKADEVLPGSIVATMIAANTITAGQIAANTITAGQIAANTITAGQLAAGSVTAAAIAAGTITTQQLAITNQPTSVVFNSNFENGTNPADTTMPAGFQKGGWGAQGSTGSIGASTAYAPYGTSVRLVIADSNSSPNFQPIALTPVTPGDVWTISFNAIASAAYNSNYVRFDTYNAAGVIQNQNAQVDGNTGESFTVATTDAVYTFSYTIPAGIYFIQPWFLVYGPGNGAARTVYVDNFRLYMSTGTFIAPGSITTGKLAANSVTATQIAANTITAGQIATGAITAAALSAGSVTAAAIASQTITATQIAANTITATQIAANTITATQIAANAISTGQLAAGSVTAAVLAAGAVTAQKLSIITGGANLLVNSSFTDTTLNGWTLAQGGTGGTQASNSAFYTGHFATKSMALTMGSSYTYTGQNVAVQGTMPITISLDIYSATAGQIRFVLRPNAGTAYLAALRGVAANTWNHVTATLPPDSASATSAALNIGWEAGDVAQNYVAYLDNVQLQYGDTATEYSPKPDEVLPGTIVASMIVANTITATQIASSTITSAQIASNTITAAQIAANTITSAQIAANTITAAQIAANTISTGQIAAGAITAALIAANAITADMINSGTIGTSTLTIANNGSISIGTPGAVGNLQLTSAGLIAFGQDASGNTVQSVTLSTADGSLTLTGAGLNNTNITNATIGSSTMVSSAIQDTGITMPPGSSGYVTAKVNGSQTSQTYTTSTTWTCPAGVTKVKVQAWAGGGAGAGVPASAQATAGGGGGGEYAQENVVNVTPGTVYTITVGTGGVGAQNAAGNAGGVTQFIGDNLTVKANGGKGGSGIGYGTGGTGSSNSIHFDGGRGGAGIGNASSGQYGAGGGSSAGTGAKGVAGTASKGSGVVAGGVAPTGGGNGGATNAAGVAPGGGGGGDSNTSPATGSSGAAGKMILTYGGALTTAFSLASTAGTDSDGVAYPAGLVVTKAGGGYDKDWNYIGASGKPAFQNSWANTATATDTQASYYKDALGFVHLRGVITGGTAANPAFTLPAGYRSGNTLHFIGTSTGTTYWHITMRSDGTFNMTSSVSGATYAGFEVVFMAEN